MTRADEPEYVFQPSERPLFPGAPFNPRQAPAARLGYAAIAILSGVGATYANALVTVNQPNLAGGLGVDVTMIAWLPAVFVAMNATANLALVKARAQFGVPVITFTLCLAYAGVSIAGLIAPSFGAAVAARAVSGLLTSALTSVTIYNLFQAFPAKHRTKGLILGIGLLQLGTPLARMTPVEMLALDGWRGQHLIELGLALTVLAATIVLPIPPTEKVKVFEPLDLLTMAFAIPGMILLCGVLSVGRLVWWTDTPWVGWALAASIPLLGCALAIEHMRQRPLLQTRWLATGDLLRFILVALLVRLALAEQTYGSVGLLTLGGLTNDQLHTLFALVGISMLAGMGAAVLRTDDTGFLWKVALASIAIAIGAGLDTGSNNLTRTPELYASQCLIGFGTTLFIGPALLYGIGRVLAAGSTYLASFIVMFATTQNVGGLLGSAIMGSLQIIRTRDHLTVLAGRIDGADPLVFTRLGQGAALLSPTLPDSGVSARQGGALLAQAVTREANILAYNDVFAAICVIAIASALVALAILGWRQVQTAVLTNSNLAHAQ